MHSAEILPFPRKIAQKPEDRLRAALRKLDDAMADQKLAFAELRANIAALGGAVSGLGGAMAGYRASLASAAQDLEAARLAARRLEGTADLWLKQGR